MLGFDAEERLIQKLPQDFAAKVVWGSRYPHHDATSGWDAMTLLLNADVPKPLIARMMGQKAADQFGIEPIHRMRRLQYEERTEDGTRGAAFSKTPIRCSCDEVKARSVSNGSAEGQRVAVDIIGCG